MPLGQIIFGPEVMNILHIGCHNGEDHVLDFCKTNKNSINSITLVDANMEVLKLAKGVYLKNFDKEKVKIYNLAVLPINLDGLEIPIYQPEGEIDSTIASVRADFVSLHCLTKIDKTHLVKSTTLNKLLETEKGVTHLFVDIEGLDTVTLFNTDLHKFPNIKQIIFECLHSDGIVEMGKRLEALAYYLDSIGFNCSTDNTEYNMKAIRR
jgi:hypothetical protein